MRNDRERLRDILEAIERIERYVPDGQPRYGKPRQVKPGVKIFHFNLKVPKGILVVDATSTEPNNSCERAIPVEKDNISIAKPPSRCGIVYRYARSFLRDCIASIEHTPEERLDFGTQKFPVVAARHCSGPTRTRPI